MRSFLEILPFDFFTFLKCFKSYFLIFRDLKTYQLLKYEPIHKIYRHSNSAGCYWIFMVIHNLFIFFTNLLFQDLVLVTVASM